MITFDRGRSRFNFRTAAVAIRRGRVLLHHGPQDDFWALPGGRVELGESTDAALRREMREELDCPIRIRRLLWTVENFFRYDGRAYHELSTVYLVDLGRAALPDEFTRRLDIRPGFLRRGLTALPASPEHIVHRDGP